MLKKNDRVKLGDKFGTVVGNSYRVYEGEGRDRYCEIWIDGAEYIETVKVDSLELI